MNQRGYFLAQDRANEGKLNAENKTHDSDIYAVEKKNMISITPMIVDRTDYRALEEVKDKNIIL